MSGNKFTDLLTIKDLQHRLKFGHTKVHQLVTSGELPSLKIGKSRRVRLVDLEEYLERLVQNAS